MKKPKEGMMEKRKELEKECVVKTRLVRTQPVRIQITM